jgi:hypothetical protein
MSPPSHRLLLAAALVGIACSGPMSRPRNTRSGTGLGGFGPTPGSGGSDPAGKPEDTGGTGGEDAGADAVEENGGTGGALLTADASAGTGGALANDASATGGTGGKLDASSGTGGAGGKLDASPGTGGSGGKLDAAPGTGGSSAKLDASPGTGGSGGKLDAAPGTGGSGGKLDAAPGTGGSGSLDAAPGTGGTSGTWMKANLTNFTSYPDPGSEECIVYNGCMWAGQFAFVAGTQSESWVMSHNIAAIHEKDAPTYKLKTLRLRQGTRTIDVKVYDECADSDCSGCCTQNARQNGLNFLIDIEKYTMQRFGTGDGIVEWMCVDCN